MIKPTSKSKASFGSRMIQTTVTYGEKEIHNAHFKDFTHYAKETGQENFPTGDYKKVLPTLPLHKKKSAEKSRIRGISHPRPFDVYLGSLNAILFHFLSMTVVIGVPLFIFYLPEHFNSFLGIVALFVCSLVFHIIFMVRVRCRVCSCPLFYVKFCQKHKKALRLFSLGYVASLSLHVLLYNWFRCMYCGTSMRLK